MQVENAILAPDVPNFTKMNPAPGGSSEKTVSDDDFCNAETKIRCKTFLPAAEGFSAPQSETRSFIASESVLPGITLKS